MNHQEFWFALDKFAKSRGLSCSSMARKCGLDATIFNKSKRFSKMGQPRWLSVGTLAKILNATGTNIHEFVRFFPDNTKKTK